MTGGQRYTPDQLLRLRKSELICKPDGLPAIEQWMEQQPEQRNKQQQLRAQNARSDEHPSEHETPQRPSLLNAGRMTRTSTTASDDVILGPPKTSFASASAARNPAKSSESNGKPTQTTQLDETSNNDRTNFRDRFFKERDNDRTRDRMSVTNGRRVGRDDAEGWTSVKPRKSFGHDEGERMQRNGDRNRQQNGNQRERDGEFDNENAGRRNVAGRAKFEQPWLREENNLRSREVEEDREMVKDRGWRDRERDKDRRNEREWTRGIRMEQDPEWMDESSEKKEKNQAHTQEDFQRWKERMKAGATPAEEKEEPVAEPVLSVKQVPALSKPVTPLAADVNPEKMFGHFGDRKPSETLGKSSTPLSNSQSAKPKSSRFAGFFAPKEEKPRAQAEALLPTATTASPAPSVPNEDKEGFQRILQMLGGANIGSQPSQAKPVGSGPASLSDLLSTHKPSQSARASQQTEAIPFDDGKDVFGAPMRDHVLKREAIAELQHEDHESIRAMTGQEGRALFSPREEFGQGNMPESMGPNRGLREQRRSMYDDTSLRNGPSRDSADLKSLLNNDAARPAHLSRDREFLLNLIQPSMQTSIERRSQQAPRQLDSDGFQLFLDNKPPHQPAPKPEALPPGLFDGRLLDNGPFSQPDPQRRDQDASHERALRQMRQTSQRPTSGFFEDSSNQFQRNKPQQEPNPNRRPSIPQHQQFPHDNFFMKAQMQQNQSQPQPQHPQARTQQDRNVAPPPGFSASMRHAPGFGIPGPPPMSYGPYHGAPPQGPQGAPPGFFNPSSAPGGGMGQGSMPPGFAPPHLRGDLTPQMFEGGAMRMNMDGGRNMPPLAPPPPGVGTSGRPQYEAFGEMGPPKQMLPQMGPPGMEWGYGMLGSRKQ